MLLIFHVWSLALYQKQPLTIHCNTEMCVVNINILVIILFFVVFSACGGIYTGDNMPVLTAYFAVLA